MREWTELYRDFLAAYNALGEAVAMAKTLHERDTRRIAELEAQLAANAGEWRPRVPGPIFNADSAPHGVKSILYLSVDATRDLDSGLWDWDDNGDWYVHGYQPLPTPPADDSERYNSREPGQ